MVKVGDKVALFDNIGKVGEVIEVYYKSVSAWFVGGVSSKQQFAKIKYPDGSIESYRSSKLMNLHER